MEILPKWPCSDWRKLEREARAPTHTGQLPRRTTWPLCRSRLVGWPARRWKKEMHSTGGAAPTNFDSSGQIDSCPCLLAILAGERYNLTISNGPHAYQSLLFIIVVLQHAEYSPKINPGNAFKRLEIYAAIWDSIHSFTLLLSLSLNAIFPHPLRVLAPPPFPLSKPP